MVNDNGNGSHAGMQRFQECQVGFTWLFPVASCKAGVRNQTDVIDVEAPPTAQAKGAAPHDAGLFGSAALGASAKQGEAAPETSFCSLPMTWASKMRLISMSEATGPADMFVEAVPLGDFKVTVAPGRIEPLLSLEALAKGILGPRETTEEFTLDSWYLWKLLLAALADEVHG
ncbi:hypothetical protein AK812_SmicGene30183 [Symbiodinium microadriaticum]|uniref:Uncharacterized protein n=1 Tax=Symbiodinium microadriaticum TaxID=2951 RepID=A0A1Q9D008_SYMMI|nr:hypothetical protein AK812_SmicGene30183 [Symbiodinium microadriaticum]